MQIARATDCVPPWRYRSSWYSRDDEFSSRGFDVGEPPNGLLTRGNAPETSTDAILGQRSSGIRGILETNQVNTTRITEQLRGNCWTLSRRDFLRSFERKDFYEVNLSFPNVRLGWQLSIFGAWRSYQWFKGISSTIYGKMGPVEWALSNRTSIFSSTLFDIWVKWTLG